MSRRFRTYTASILAFVLVVGVLTADAADCYLLVHLRENSANEVSIVEIESKFGNFDKLTRPYSAALHAPSLVRTLTNTGATAEEFMGSGGRNFVGEDLLGDSPKALHHQFDSRMTSIYIPYSQDVVALEVEHFGQTLRYDVSDRAVFACEKDCGDLHEVVDNGFPCCDGYQRVLRLDGKRWCTHCGDGACDEGENGLQCAPDCKINYETLRCAGGVRAFTDCAGMIAAYPFNGSLENAVGRNVSLSSKNAEFVKVAPENGAVHLNKNSAAVRIKRLKSLPLGSVTVRFQLDRIRRRQSLLSIGRVKKNSIVLGVNRRGQPFVRILQKRRKGKRQGANLEFSSSKGKKQGEKRRILLLSDLSVQPGWNSVTFTYSDGGFSKEMQLTLALNGSIVASQKTNSALRFRRRGEPLLIGSVQDSKRIRKWFLEGMIDTITLWSRPLDIEELPLFN